MATPLHILIVEDSEDDTRLLLHALQKGGYDPVYERVDTGSAMEMALARRKWKMLAILFVGPGRFKAIVHPLGDRSRGLVLRGVAGRLRARLEEGDTLARMGGDEFVILLPQINRADRAVRVAQRVIEAI